MFRPFATDRLLKALPQTVERIAVLDRTKEPVSYTHLMEQELNIYLMVECWIRDYIDINDMYIRMVEDGHEILEWESFLPSELSYRSLFVASNYKLGYKNQCIDYLYARFKQVVKLSLIHI